MGPQHPSTHGVLKVMLELEGERLVKSTPVMGFLHRGVEKLAEDGTYHQFIPHTDRLDYVCAMYNNFAYCRAVEKLMNITVPDRAEYLRTIVAEVQRIIGHQFWLGTQALDIGAMTVFFYCFRDREILLDWFDELCGARLTTSWYRIGGVERDFTPSLFAKASKQFLDYFPPKIDEYVVFLEKNRIWLARTKGVAVISAEDALSFGLSGPTLRGSGVDYDLRKYEPYSAYPKCEFSVPVGKNGDTYDRYWIRVQEMYESVKIIRQCLEQMPGRAHHGGCAERHLAAEGTGVHESGVHDPAVQVVLAGIRCAPGRNLLRDGGAQRRAGLLYRQYGRRQAVPAENPRSLVHSHGRV